MSEPRQYWLELSTENTDNELMVNFYLRWPEPIYMSVDYVFESRFSAGTNLSDSYDFWSP